MHAAARIGQAARRISRGRLVTRRQRALDARKSDFITPFAIDDLRPFHDGMRLRFKLAKDDVR